MPTPTRRWRMAGSRRWPARRPMGQSVTGSRGAKRAPTGGVRRPLLWRRLHRSARHEGGSAATRTSASAGPLGVFCRQAMPGRMTTRRGESGAPQSGRSMHRRQPARRAGEPCIWLWCLRPHLSRCTGVWCLSGGPERWRRRRRTRWRLRWRGRCVATTRWRLRCGAGVGVRGGSGGSERRR